MLKVEAIGHIGLDGLFMHFIDMEGATNVRVFPGSTVNTQPEIPALKTHELPSGSSRSL